MKKIFQQALPGLLFIILTTVILFYACKKKDNAPAEKANLSMTDKFFTLKEGTNPTVAAVATSVKRQNNRGHFLERLTMNAGYPVWDKAILVERNPGEGQQVFIPFINETKKQTRAILIVKIKGTDTLYHLLYNTQALQYGYDATVTGENWNAKDIFHAFIIFDYQLFGHKKFTVADSRLVDAATEGAHTLEILQLGKTASTNREQTSYLVTVPITFVVCGQCGFKNGTAVQDRCCNATYYTQEVSYWFDDATDDWSYETPEGGWPGGGEPCPGCDWAYTNPCPLDGQGHAIGFCDDNWTPVTEEPYNPLIYDSITVDHQVEDSFPCLYSLLKNDMEKINQKSQLMLSSIFGVSLYNNLHFQMNYSFTKDSAIMGTKKGYKEWIGDQMYFYDTVEMNPYYAFHATKEQLIAAIVHESIHAYINWCFRAYQDEVDGIDSNYLKEHFPFYWDYFKGRDYSSSTQHDLIVSNYINEIVNAVVAGGNQSAPLLLRRYVGTALAYSGLHETSVWGHLSSSDRCNYEGVQDWSQDYDKPSNFVVTIAGCRNYDRTFRDSLQLLGRCQ